MRYTVLILFVCLLSLQLGLLLGRPEPTNSCIDAATSADTAPCIGPDVETAIPSSIDDRAMKKHVASAGGTLIDDGAAAEIAGLIKQLALETCELQLAKTSAMPSDGSLYDYAKESIVVVAAIYKCDRCDHWHAGCASGFVISSSGAIATNYHVVNQPEKSALVAMTADGRVLPVTRVLAANEANDVAILQVDGEGLRPLAIARTAAIGSPIAVISHPDEHYFSYTNGVVSRYTRVPAGKENVEAMVITADFARGSSGAPVLNMRGEVVGIVRSTESIYYSVENGQQKNLQMVFKTCVPAVKLLDLVAE